MPLVDGLALHGTRVALQTADRAVTYAELAGLVEDGLVVRVGDAYALP